MKASLQELADLVGGTVEGDPSTVITGISGVKEARKGDVTFIANKRYVGLLQETQASAVVVHKDLGREVFGEDVRKLLAFELLHEMLRGQLSDIADTRQSFYQYRLFQVRFLDIDYLYRFHIKHPGSSSSPFCSFHICPGENIWQGAGLSLRRCIPCIGSQGYSHRNRGI